MTSILKFIAGAAILVCSSFVIASCDFSDDNNSYSAAVYSTLVNDSGRAKMLVDGGGIIYPTKESVNSITDNKGFDYSRKKAHIYFYYMEKNVTKATDGSNNYICNDAEVYYGRYFDTEKIMTKAEADVKGVFQEDSLFYLYSLSDLWVTNGFLNVTGQGYYSSKNGQAVKPTVDLVYDPDEIGQNSIKFTLFYNKHSKQDALDIAEYEVMSFFELADLEGKIPGSDSIRVTLVAPNVGTLQCNLGRNQFLPDEGVYCD